ncbi:MAG: tripartite tricarboxylate transporter TctB family protein [Lachnospiraceae bacterium]|nr:tripartite tricarboxylate transporter TctB family protein [Lachnospiraceae bacterium]
MKEVLKPGERAFSISLLAVNIWEISEAFKMCVKKPGLSSYGALPLGLGIIMLLCLCKIILLEDRKKTSERKKLRQSFLDAIMFVFPKDIAVFVGMMLIYFAALLLGAGFMIATPFFLFISMCYMMPHEIIKNGIFTVILVALIYIIFKMIFKVTLP